MPSLFRFICALTLSLFLHAGAEAGETKAQICLTKVKMLNQKKDIIQEAGGLWAYFSKSGKLRAFSTSGLQLDSKVNLMTSALQRLCDTMNGIPLNSLAIFLTENLKRKSKEAFREEQILLGKNHGVIDVWIKFHDISLKNQHRLLDFAEIDKSFKKANPLLDKYKNLQKVIDQAPEESINGLTTALLEELDYFLTNDPMVSQGIREDAQVPYWDINESSGGS